MKSHSKSNKDGVKLVAGRVDIKPAEALPDYGLTPEPSAHRMPAWFLKQTNQIDRYPFLRSSTHSAGIC
jgi:hypothetical protein